MKENKKSPECELEALRKLKRSLFMDYWAYWERPYNLKAFLRVLKHLDYAGFADEADRFCDLFNETFDKHFSVEQGDQFLQDYFGV